MTVKLCLYAFSFLVSVFIVSSLNINSIFKKDRIWEARVFIITFIIIISYILQSFLYDIVTMMTLSL